MSKNKIFFSDNDVRTIISNCISFTELNTVLRLFLELRATGSTIPEKTIYAYSKLYYLNLSLKNEQCN